MARRPRPTPTDPDPKATLQALASDLLASRGGLAKPLRDRVRTCPEVVGELKRRADAALGVDVREALRLARVARNAGRASGDELALGTGLHALAKACHASGRYRSAASSYEAAAEAYSRSGQPHLRAKIDLALVDVLLHLGRHREAEQAAARARRTLLRLGDDVTAAKTLANLANLRHAQDRHAEAVRLLERVRPVLEAAGERAGVALIDYNRANSYSLMARFDRSVPLYTDARRAFEALGQTEQVAIVDYNLAYDHFLQGRLHEARRTLASARRTFRRAGSRHRLALAALDESEMALTLNLPAEAAEASSEARSEFLAMGAHLEAARAALFGGEAAHLQGDLGQAAALYTEARQAFARKRHAPLTAAADLALAGLPSESPSRRQARAVRAAQVFARSRLAGKEAAALTVAGSVALERSQLARAKGHLQRATRLARRRGLPEAELRAEHALARAEEAGQRPRVARRHYRRAIEAYERLRSGIRSDTDRLAFAADKSVVFEDALRVSLDAGRLDEAFELVERARSRALVDLLSVDPRFSESTLGRGGRLSRRLSRLKGELAELEARARVSERRDQVVPTGLKQKLQHALKEHDRATARLAEDAPQASYEVSGRPVVELEELRHTLGGDRALLAYFSEGDRLGVLLITDRLISVNRDMASLAEVQRALEVFRFTVTTPRIAPERAETHARLLAASAYAPLETLRRLLVEPLEPLLGERSLVVVPPASLHLVPFHALTRQGRPLIEDREVSVAPSSTVLVWASRRRPKTSGTLVVAVPDEAAPAIEEEARLVAKRLDGRLLAGPQATAEAVRREAPHARVIHLAAHGVYQPDEPLLSGIRLADGRFTAPEIAALGMDAALVTLSACDTAMGTPTGDELLGLLRSVLQGGTRSVVASLWAVHDASTAELMQAFYARLERGDSITAALRHATLALRRDYPHPYHWAPFVAVGGWAGLEG